MNGRKYYSRFTYPGIFVLTLIYLSYGQELFVGWCPNIQPINPFYLQNYSGLWWEVEKYWFIPETQASCVRVRYVDNGDQTFTVNILQLVNGKEWDNSGITKYTKSAEDGADFILDLIIQQSPIPFVISYPYYVLHTDYVNYTIKYACKQVGFYNLQTMWILTRSKVMTPEIRRIVYDKLTSFGLDTSRLTQSDLTHCPDQI